MKLISNVKKLAVSKNLTAYDLAKLAGTTPQTVYGLWSGKDISTKRALTLFIIAKALDVSVEDLCEVR